MKRKKWFLLAFLVCIGMGVQMSLVHADSGWHGSYGGGSHSSGGYHSSSRYHGSRSSSSGDVGDFFFVVVVIGVVIVISLASSKKQKKAMNSMAYSIPPYDIDKIRAVLPNFDKNKFRMQVFSMYKTIEEAWMNFDYEVLRKCTTDELYNLNHSQLVALQVKKQKNVMKDFELKAFEIVGMEKIENMVALTVQMTVECFDYVVDKNNKVVRGTDKNKLIYDYEMTFIKGMDQKENKCPNCNAPLENGNSTVCPYCDSVIINENHDWVLSKKEMKSQRMK